MKVNTTMRRGLAGLGFAAFAVALAMWPSSPPTVGPAPHPAARATPTASMPAVAARQANRTAIAGIETTDAHALLGSRGWSAVDLERAREALPGNLYWQLLAPTDDPEVLARRQRDKQARELLYGKVLSNTATSNEVNEFYAHRQQASVDYIEFVSYVLGAHGGQLPERDVTLLQFAQELHIARIEELPRNQAEALARRDAHAHATQAWRAQQRAFGQEHTEPQRAARRTSGSNTTVAR